MRRSTLLSFVLSGLTVASVFVGGTFIGSAQRADERSRPAAAAQDADRSELDGQFAQGPKYGTQKISW